MEQSFYVPPDLCQWIEHHIQKPIAGFEHKKKANGQYYSYEEQLKATKYQLTLIASTYLQSGKTSPEVVQRLQWFA